VFTIVGGWLKRNFKLTCRNRSWMVHIGKKCQKRWCKRYD